MATTGSSSLSVTTRADAEVDGPKRLVVERSIPRRRHWAVPEVRRSKGEPSAAETETFGIGTCGELDDGDPGFRQNVAMSSREEKRRRKALLAPMIEAQRDGDRRRFREQFGDDEADVQDALEPLWSTRPEGLTEAQRWLLLVYGLTGLVDGDGFECWLVGHGSEWAATRDSLRLFGLDEAADLLEGVVEVVGNPCTADWDAVDLDAMRH